MAREEAATTDRPFGSSFIRRVLVGAAMAAVVSLLLLAVGPTKEAAAQAQSDAQVHCGRWQAEQRGSSDEPQYWNYRWCHSPAVSGGYYKDYADYSLVSPEETTVQQTAAGDNNYSAQQEGNPLVYKSADSRRDFREGLYKHVFRCPEGYKAIGGGFSLQTPDQPQDPGRTNASYWQILDNRPSYYWWDHYEETAEGDGWVVSAYGHRPWLSGSLPTFSAYAACAPQNLLTGLRYEEEWKLIDKDENTTTWPTCGGDERVIGGGFHFLRDTTDLHLVRTERARDDERAWGSGAKNTGGSSAWLVARAVCVSSGALEASEYKEGADAARERVEANTPRCSQGTYLLSGGAGMPNSAYDRPTTPFWVRSGPPQVRDNYWNASVLWRYSAPITVHAFALCGKFAGQ